MNRHGGLVTSGNGVNGKLGTRVDVAAHKDIGLRSLIRLRIGNGALTATKLDSRALQQVAPLDALANGKDNLVALDGHKIILVILGGKASVIAKHARAALEHNATHRTRLVGEYLLGAPAAADVDAVLASLGNLLVACGHLLGRLEAQHRNLGGLGTRSHASSVDSNVAATHNHRAAHRRGSARSLIGVLDQEVNSDPGALRVLPIDAGQTASLAADSNVEGGKALLA